MAQSAENGDKLRSMDILIYVKSSSLQSNTLGISFYVRGVMVSQPRLCKFLSVAEMSKQRDDLVHFVLESDVVV